MSVESQKTRLYLKRVYPISNIYFWTDSSTVLCWKNNTKDVCKPYVQHGLIIVRELIV